MNESLRDKGPILLGVVVFSLPVGFLFAGLFCAARDGISTELFRTFDIFTFWYETPLYLGYASPAFTQGLMIMGGVCVLMLAIALFFMFRGHDHQGSARWARYGEMARAGYIRRYDAVTGPIFGKTSGPGWAGHYLTNGDQPHSLVVAPTRAGRVSAWSFPRF